MDKLEYDLLRKTRDGLGSMYYVNTFKSKNGSDFMLKPTPILDKLINKGYMQFKQKTQTDTVLWQWYTLTEKGLEVLNQYEIENPRHEETIKIAKNSNKLAFWAFIASILAITISALALFL
jgi:hypothetical protein